MTEAERRNQHVLQWLDRAIEKREAAILRETAMECARIVCGYCAKGSVVIREDGAYWHGRGCYCHATHIRERFRLDEQPKPEGSDA